MTLLLLLLLEIRPLEPVLAEERDKRNNKHQNQKEGRKNQETNSLPRAPV
jgi:hypothetical protein